VAKRVVLPAQGIKNQKRISQLQRKIREAEAQLANQVSSISKQMNLQTGRIIPFKMANKSMIAPGGQRCVQNFIQGAARVVEVSEKDGGPVERSRDHR
jgi:hypothetical protein